MRIDATRGYLSGLRNRLRRLEGIRVFYYHGVVERKTDPLLERNFNLVAEFQSHIRFLQKFRILSLAELADELLNNRPRFTRGAVITFDDGYANNSLIAEIANAARFPWSLFISTGGVGSESALWPAELALLLLHGQAAEVEVLGRVWSIKNRDERVVGFRSIQREMKAMPSRIRRHTLDCLRQQFPERETQRLLYEFPSLQMLSWKQTRQLVTAGAEVASHGVDHEIHHMNQEADTRWRELTESKSELAMRVDRPCDFFAFPNGDFTPTSADEVQRAGYRLGFTTQPNTVMRGADPYVLPRYFPAGPLQQFARDFFWGQP